MKWRLICFGLIAIAILFLQTNSHAQRSQTKCPPKAKKGKHKMRTELVKFPALMEKDRDRRKAERKMGYAPRKKQKQVKEVDPKENFYVKGKEPKMKIQKVTDKPGGSTDCPH